MTVAVFLVGLIGIVYEVAINDAMRPVALFFYAAMMGVPQLMAEPVRKVVVEPVQKLILTPLDRKWLAYHEYLSGPEA